MSINTNNKSFAGNLNKSPINIRNRISHLSNALGDLKTNLQTEMDYKEEQSKMTGMCMRDLQEEVTGLKRAFKTMVDLMLQEVEAVRTDQAIQGTELHNKFDHKTNDLSSR